MNTGYIDDYQYKELNFWKEHKLGVIYQENCFYYNANLMDEEIDLIKIFRKYSVIVDKLERFWIHSTQASIKNIDILKKAKQVRDISITNSALKDIKWLKKLILLDFLTLSSICTLSDNQARGSFYHPIKSLLNLERLNLSFSGFDDKSIFVSEGETIFDQLLNVSYLNLRETNIKNTNFLSFITAKNILLNYSDNVNKLDVNSYENINLVTKIKLENNTTMDISKYLLD